MDAAKVYCLLNGQGAELVGCDDGGRVLQVTSGVVGLSFGGGVFDRYDGDY